MPATLTSVAKSNPAPNDPKQGRKSKTTTDTIRVESDIAYKIGVIISVEGGSSSDVASPILRDEIERRFQEAVRKLNQQAGNVPCGGKKKPTADND